MSISEPPPPRHGLTRTEREPNRVADQGQTEPQLSNGRRLVQSISPRFVLSQANGYPIVVKQFLQFCLLLIYPAWVFGFLASAVLYYAFYVTVYPVLWLIFWPVRAWMKRYRPDEYAASRSS